MHRLKAHIRVLTLCACALLASCVRPTEANFRKTATPRVDEYSRLLIRQMLARDTSFMRRKFSPALLQIPHASDSLAALARHFPGGAERVKLVGVNQQWTSYVTTRLLTYEVRSRGGQYAAVQVQTLEDELHNLYVNGFHVQPLDGPIPQPAPLIPMAGVLWWPVVLLLLLGGIFALAQLFRKRPASDPRTVPLFPDTPGSSAQRAAAGRRARTGPQPGHTPDAAPYIAPAILMNEAAVSPAVPVAPAEQVDCTPVADPASIHSPPGYCGPESGYTDSATADSTGSGSAGFGFDPAPDSSYGTGSGASYDSGASSSYDSGSDVRFD